MIMETARTYPSLPPDPAFFRLPEELLTLLVSAHVKAHQNTPHGESLALRSLRLIHPRFAFLPSLCKWLFAFVVLTPDPDRRQLQDWSFIGPYVREVYLEPLLHTDPNLPWLDDQARKNARRALEPYQRYIDCGDAATALARVLCALTNLQKIFIMSNAKDTQISFPAGDRFIAFATHCLHLAGMKPERLELKNIGIRELWSMAPLASWMSSPMDDRLQLCNLRALSIELQNSSIPGHMRAHMAFEKIAGAICRVLERCGDTLEDLSIATRTAIIWYPTVGPPPMFNLRNIRLSDCGIEPGGLGEWLMSCKAITNITMTSVALLDSPTQLGLEPWKPLFDALRHHPSRIALKVDSMELSYDYTSVTGYKYDVREVDVILVHHTSNHALKDDDILDDCYPEHPTNHQEWPNVRSMLKEYMSGVRDWDLPLGW